MKKSMALTKLFAIVLSFAALAGFSGCSRQIETSIENYTSELSVDMPDEYFISYKVEQVDGTITEVSKGQDMAGNIYFKSGEYEAFFIPDGNQYHMYQSTESTSLQMDDRNTYDIDYIDETTEEFSEYANRSFVQKYSSSQKMQDAVIAERSSEVYELSNDMLLFTQKFTFAIDKETGITMQWNSDATLADYEISTDSISFICTEFSTHNIVLPIFVDTDISIEKDSN